MMPGELIELQYDGIFATCECGSDCWHVVVDKPGNFTRIEGVICAGCSDFIRFEGESDNEPDEQIWIEGGGSYTFKGDKWPPKS